MQDYVIRRVTLMVPTLLGISVFIFLVMHLMPGDVVLQMLAESASFDPANVEALRRQLGLDRPLIEQYFSWVVGLVQLDLGTSLWTGQPVTQEILSRLPITLELGLLSIALGVLTGMGFGVISAVRQDTLLDYSVRLVSIMGIAVPNFVVGTLLVLLPAIWFGYFGQLRFVPITENVGDNLMQFLFPAAALALRLSASSMRMMRSTMLEVIRQDYIRTARAKGLRELTVIARHALKNAMIPVVTIIGDQAILAVGGSVIIESIFGLPGVGRLLVEAITRRDLTVVQGVVMFFALFVLLTNLVVDLSYAWFDPRIRYRKVAT